MQEVGDDIEVEDVVDHIEDELSGLMTTSTMEQSATLENDCAIETEVCLSERLLYHRGVDEDCQGGNGAREGVINRLRRSNYIDRDCRQRTSGDERPRGHPHFFFYFAFWAVLFAIFAVSFERMCLFLCRLSPSIEYIYEHASNAFVRMQCEFM